MKLDSEAIRARRTELGLSQRDLARRVGAGDTLAFHIETDGDRPEITLREIDRLADALAVDPITLLVSGEPQTAVQGSTNRSEPSSTIARLGSLLQRADTAVPLSVLGEVLGVDRESLTATLVVLDEQLQSVGLRVHLHEDCAQIVSSGIDGIAPDKMKDLRREASARRSIDKHQASLLYRVMLGKLTAKKVASNNDRVRFRQLVNAGLIEEPTTDSVKLDLCEAVKTSLLLDVFPA